MRKKILEKRMQRLLGKKKTLTERADASQDVAELRAINEQLSDINEEIEEVQEELDSLDDEPTPAPEPAPVPDDAEQRGGNPFNSYHMNPVQKRTNESPYDSLEYRQAFMKYVQTGEWNYRADETLITTDVGKIIPNTIMNEFLKEIKIYGQLFNRVRKLNIKGGVEFPIQELIPTVTWITETTTSETQAVPEIKTSIQFGYHIVEARLAQSLLSQVVSLNYLETEMARLLAEAFVKEFDRVILKGSGSGQPLGILNDNRIDATHKIQFTPTDMADWTKFRKNLFAKIPLAYRGQGIFVMTAATWEANIMTLKDANNRPLYQETYNPTTGQLECRFAGREVVLVESDMLADYDTASTGDVWGLYFRPSDYAVNTNLQIGFKRWFDDDKNKYFNKGLCIMDGKMLDVNGAYILKK
jgi:HK97 family phage major capsid protein